MKGCNCVGCAKQQQGFFTPFWVENKPQRTKAELIQDCKNNFFLFVLFSFGGLFTGYISLPLSIACWGLAIIFMQLGLFDKKLYLERFVK